MTAVNVLLLLLLLYYITLLGTVSDGAFNLCAVNEGKGSAGRPAYQGVIHAMRTIVKNSGFVGLYQGVTPNVSGAGISWGCYFFLWVIPPFFAGQAKCVLTAFEKGQ